MATAKNKTQPTAAAVEAFLGTLGDARRADCRALCELMQSVTGEPAVMWGPAIVGFGTLHYRYESGREGDICRVGFSPRKANLSLYLGCGLETVADLLPKLGKHTVGKGCLYLKKLADADPAVLREVVARAAAGVKGA